MNIDLNYRPKSYFWPVGLGTHLLATVKGAARQAHIRRLIESGDLDQLEDWLAHASLTDGQREQIGRLHPSLMGGEYLPDLRKNEVEIARVSLQSVTGDVFSIRATRGKRRIHFRAVDEYDGDCLRPAGRHSSTRPLTLGQLVEFIETTVDCMGIIKCNMEGGLSESNLREFLSVSSPFYPSLGSFFAEKIDCWIDEAFPKNDEEEDY